MKAVVIDAIFNLIFGFFTAVLSLLPSFTPPDWLSSPGELCSSQLACDAFNITLNLRYVRDIIDVEALVNVVTGVMAVWVASVGVKGIIWLYDKIPGKSA